jgi:hypothetical protein
VKRHTPLAAFAFALISLLMMTNQFACMFAMNTGPLLCYDLYECTLGFLHSFTALGMSRQFVTTLILCTADNSISATYAPCTGKSVGLNPATCATWQDFALATNITGWTPTRDRTPTRDTNCTLRDPCSCHSSDPKLHFKVKCAGADITQM